MAEIDTKQAAKEVASQLSSSRDLPGPATTKSTRVIFNGKGFAVETVRFQGKGWTLAIEIGGVRYRLERYEKVGVPLDVRAFVRIPALERLLAPELSDAEYDALPFAETGFVQPTMCGGFRVPPRSYFRFEADGGAAGVAQKVVEQLTAWMPLMESPLALAEYAFSCSELDPDADGARGIQGLWWKPTAALAAALGLCAAGQPGRAREIMTAWSKHPLNQDLDTKDDVFRGGMMTRQQLAAAQAVSAAIARAG